MITATARNLLIITLDSVRADYFRGHVLDRLKAEGTYFSQAITCAPSTPESHAAMFSGCYPPIHGLRNHHARSNDRTPHLFEILEDSGFEVAACTRLASVPARVVGSADDIVAAAHELRSWRSQRRHALFFHVWRTHFPYLIASSLSLLILSFRGDRDCVLSFFIIWQHTAPHPSCNDVSAIRPCFSIATRDVPSEPISSHRFVVGID